MSTYTKGQEVMLPKGMLGEVQGYSKGWYAILTDSGTMVKARGKDLRQRPRMTPNTDETPRKAAEGHGKRSKAPVDTNIATPTKTPKEKVKKARRGKSNGDSVAAELEAAFGVGELDGVYHHVAKVIDRPLLALKTRYNHLNHGQQRMVLGNLLRSFYRAKGILPGAK